MGIPVASAKIYDQLSVNNSGDNVIYKIFGSRNTKLRIEVLSNYHIGRNGIGYTEVVWEEPAFSYGSTPATFTAKAIVVKVDVTRLE